MTTISCPICHDPTNDGLPCRVCVASLRAALRDLPWLLRELRVTLTRQNQAMHGGGRGGDDNPLPYNINAAEVMATVISTVGTWIGRLDEYADPGPTMKHWCGWLLLNMPLIRRHAAAEQAFADLTGAAKTARQAIDRPADREYVQPCVVCGKAVYAAPGATTAPCHECKRVATDRDDDGNVTAVGWFPEYDVAAAHLTRLTRLRAAVLAEQDVRTAVEAIRAQPLSRKTLRSWINRGRLIPRACGLDGSPLYHVDEALTLAAAIPQRHIEPEPPTRRRVVRRVSA